MIEVPLSIAGSAEAFAAALEAHRSAVETHMMGKPGRPAPVAPHQLIHDLVQRVPDTMPIVASRGPDKIVVGAYKIVDDTPRSPEQQRALDTLRATITG